MSTDDLKEKVALRALDEIKDEIILGVGTGSTVNFLIEQLPSISHKLKGTVASSIETEKRLKEHNIPVFDVNTVDKVDLYIDGADEANYHRQLIKGGGGALTREKILASISQIFVCIIDESKLKKALGGFPLAIEVIPMARSYVARKLLSLNCSPEYRDGVVTDNGNVILDVHNLTINEPIALENTINQITGVVENGLFANRAADKILVARKDSVDVIV